VVKSGFGMTEVLNASQLILLRRVAAAGYVRIVTAEEKTALDELVARKLILGNQLTEAGWRELRKARGSPDGFIPFAPSQGSKRW
jgi:hypothetical protein